MLTKDQIKNFFKTNEYKIKVCALHLASTIVLSGVVAYAARYHLVHDLVVYDIPSEKGDKIDLLINGVYYEHN